MAKQKTKRSRLIGMIHAQRAAAGMSEDEYRASLYSWVGKESCSDCKMHELEAVFRNLNKLLAKQGQDRFMFKRRENTLRDAVALRAKKVLGDEWGNRLAGFLEKIGKKSLADCADKDLRQVMGFISRIEGKQNERTNNHRQWQGRREAF